ncbi:hypothetical protein [Pedobacter sp. MW01-1-1]|uniref:hypothetical protein n=1 Tax=Pedobacter sp. MW01-1-1 TaxID=3383027 RepID=UPI003FEF5B79
MISRIRNSIFTKFLWGFIGLYLLNISVDTTDPNPEYIPEDLSINDQESVIEILVEKVFGFEDAIKEYDDHDTDEHTKKQTLKIDLLVHVIITPNMEHNQTFERKKYYPDEEARMKSGFLKIDSPPPQV